MPPADPPPDPKLMFLFNLRKRGISDRNVLRAMEEVPRERFVEAGGVVEAYRDAALPIACGQTISQPFVVAFMTEQLDVRPEHRVLEIGTGSGYQAAVLSRLCVSVVSLERFRTLAERARKRLSDLGYTNVEIEVADGLDVPERLGAFDRIIVTAAMREVPQSLIDALAEGGVLVGPVGEHNAAQVLVRIRKTPEGIERKDLLDVRFVPALPGLAREL
ncbi:MAG: protein-L-isoaspartate O-methyltransferase [Proteobacteria bacterium]|nr:MAG: protein-L-isoaspartate O-methyltransferase [Pseudomonadota bacterium]